MAKLGAIVSGMVIAFAVATPHASADDSRALREIAGTRHRLYRTYREGRPVTCQMSSGGSMLCLALEIRSPRAGRAMVGTGTVILVTALSAFVLTQTMFSSRGCGDCSADTGRTGFITGGVLAAAGTLLAVVGGSRIARYHRDESEFWIRPHLLVPLVDFGGAGPRARVPNGLVLRGVF